MSQEKEKSVAPIALSAAADLARRSFFKNHHAIIGVFKLSDPLVVRVGGMLEDNVIVRNPRREEIDSLSTLRSRSLESEICSTDCGGTCCVWETDCPASH